jgi:hypothetical protein
MRKVISFLFFLVLGFLLFSGVVRYVGSWEELIQLFFSFPLLGWLSVLLLSLLGFYLEILRWREILKSKGIDFSVRQLWGPGLACFSVVYLAPLAVFWADFFRSRVVSQKNPPSLEKRLASVYIDRLISSFVNLAATILGSYVFFLKVRLFGSELGELYLGFIALLTFLTIFFLVFLFYSKILQKVGFFKTLGNHEHHRFGEEVKKEIFDFFTRKNLVSILKGIGLTVIKVFVLLAQYWLLVFFLGASLSPSTTFALLGTSTAALETPISADLGSHDFATALVFEKLSLGKNNGLIFALVLRGINLLLTVVGAYFLVVFSLATLRHDILQKIERFVLIKKDGEQTDS